MNSFRLLSALVLFLAFSFDRSTHYKLDTGNVMTNSEVVFPSSSVPALYPFPEHFFPAAITVRQDFDRAELQSMLSPSEIGEWYLENYDENIVTSNNSLIIWDKKSGLSLVNINFRDNRTLISLRTVRKS